MSWFQKKIDASAAAPKTGSSSLAPKGLKIGPLLSEDLILFPPEGKNKVAILSALVETVCRKAGLTDPERFLAKVDEREQGISTTLDTGLSLPHARMDGIDSILAGMAVLKTPIPDPSQPDLPIRVIFLFFSPNKQEAFPLHLQLLRGVSSMFQPALIDKLTVAAGPAEALTLVQQIEG